MTTLVRIKGCDYSVGCNKYCFEISPDGTLEHDPAQRAGAKFLGLEAEYQQAYDQASLALSEYVFTKIVDN